MKKRLVIACVAIVVTAIVVLAAHRIYLHRRIESEISKLKSHDQEAIHALGKLGQAAVAPLVEVLKGDDFWARSFAADALGHIGPPAKSAVPAIIDFLKDQDEAGRVAYKHRPYMIDSLGGIGPKAQAAVPFLGEALGDESGYVRAHAARALWDIDREPRAIPTLIEVLKDKDETWDARVAASDALGHIGPDAKAAVPVLIETLTDPSQGIYAVRALSKIGLAPEDIPALVRALGEVPKGSVHDRITAILDKINPEPE